MVDFSEYLPKEISEKVLSYLPPADLSKVSCCCKRLWEITNQDSIWLHHCMASGWLKFGVTSDLTLEPNDYGNVTNVSGTSPVFPYQEPSDSTLPQLGRWKNIYMRALHLKRNWELGRFNVGAILRGHKDKVTCLDCSNKYHRIASGSEDKLLKIWDMRSCRCLHTNRSHSDTITCLKVNEQIVVTGCDDGVIRVLDLMTAKLKFTLQGNSGSIVGLTVSVNNITAVCANRTIKVWSIGGTELVNAVRCHEDDIECMAQNGTLALTGSWDTTLMLWDTVKGEHLLTYRGHSEVVNCCQFDEKIVVSGSADATVKIWRMKTAMCTATLEGHKGEVYCVAYNKVIIASGSSDSTVILWNHSGDLLHSLQGHIGIVRCLYLNDDRLVSGGDALKLVIWDWKNGKMFHMIHRHPTKLYLMWVNDTKIITASPEKPGSLTVLTFW